MNHYYFEFETIIQDTFYAEDLDKAMEYLRDVYPEFELKGTWWLYLQRPDGKYAIEITNDPED